MKERKNQMTPLGAGLRSVLSAIDKSGKVEVAGIIEVWDEMVGPEIAAHTYISSMRQGELLVLVDSPVWAAELTAMAEQLRDRLEQETGKQSIRSIRFNVSRRVTLERREAKTEDEVERGYGGERIVPEPLSDSELEAVERSIADIEDEGLRDAARRATVTALEWKKGQETANAAQAATGGPEGARKRF